MSSGSTAEFLSSINEAVNKHLPNSFFETHTIIDSSALTQIFYTSCRNAPYCFLPHSFNLVEVLNTRIRCLEACFLAVASMVHHLFFALFYTVLTVIFGLVSQSVCDSCIAHWTHISYGAMAMVIGALGVITPFYGTYACGGLAYYLFKSVEDNYRKDLNSHETELLKHIRKAIGNNWDEITQTVKLWVKNYDGDDYRYSNVFLPAIKQAKELIDTARTVDEVFAALWAARGVFVSENYKVVNSQKN